MNSKLVDRWLGGTIYCIASGPSLTLADCEKVRLTGHPVIVANNTWEICPWSDILMACDAKWWRQYGAAVRVRFSGICLSYDRYPDVLSLCRESWFRHFANTGADTISLSVLAGASKVILLGFDCQESGGKKHWHEDHPSALESPIGMHRWSAIFAKVAVYAEEYGTQVINCSRQTALECFERGHLEEFLDH